MPRRLTGTAKDAIADIEPCDIIGEEGLTNMTKVLFNAFAPYLGQTMPRAFEKAARAGFREKGQSMPGYSLASATRFNELRREGVQLPPEARGYTMMRHAQARQGHRPRWSRQGLRRRATRRRH